MNLSDAMKDFRQRHGLNTARAGRVLGISGRTVENIEQGRAFSHSRLLMIALEKLSKKDVEGVD